MTQKRMFTSFHKREFIKSRFIIEASALSLIAFFLSVSTENNYAQTSKPQVSDCIRATPAPVVKKSVFPKSTFKLSGDKRAGTETVKFANGDKLIITNDGCEYYYLGFRFETSRFSSASAADAKYWFNAAVKLIEQTKKGIEAPAIQMSDAIEALKKYIKNTRTPVFGEEVDYGGTDIRTFVSVKKVQKISKSKFAAEIYFAVGPL